MTPSPAHLELVARPISIDLLELDPENPRLKDVGLEKDASQDEITETLWKNMAVDEVALSIAENGFYKHEPLYASKVGSRYHVIEGNRRLAAVKLLRNKRLRGALRISTLPELSATARKKLDELPVVVCTRDEIWSYLGFKHINGPQAWESYPKATYVAWVHNHVGISLEEIARKIGDKHDTVARLYDGLMVLEQAKEARVFDQDDRVKSHFSFSHLTTGLGYLGIQAFLGLPKGRNKTIGKRKPVPKSHLPQLGEFLIWLYGSKSREKQPVIKSQNPDLRKLDDVLKNKQATAALRKGLTLGVSIEISKGDARVFREALVEAKQNLQKARGTVLTGYRTNEDLKNTAIEIHELAVSLLSDMRIKPGKKSQAIER